MTTKTPLAKVDELELNFFVREVRDVIALISIDAFTTAVVFKNGAVVNTRIPYKNLRQALGL
jgi:hypothetical protein